MIAVTLSVDWLRLVLIGRWWVSVLMIALLIRGPMRHRPDQKIITAILGGVAAAELDELLGPYLPE